MSVVAERPRADTHITEKPLTLPSLPDVRPFGAELMGQRITLDEEAQYVLSPITEHSALLENVDNIEKYLKPYFEVTHTSQDEVLAMLTQLDTASSLEQLSDDVFEVARQSLQKVQSTLLDSISVVPDAIKSLTGEVPEFRFDNIGIGLFKKDGNEYYSGVNESAPEHCISIETTEPVSCFLMYAEKLDETTREFLGVIALSIAVKCEATPVPHAFGCHGWFDDYLSLTTDQAFELNEYAQQDAWSDDSFSTWMLRLKDIMGNQVSEVHSMMYELHMMDITDIPEEDLNETEGDTGDFLETYRETASEALMRIVLQSGPDYRGGEVDAEFLRDLQGWRNSPHCQHTEVVDKLIAVTTVIQEHLPTGGDALESLTEIPDFGVGLLYSMPSIDACYRTRVLIDEHAQYQMETCEQCIFQADWTNPEWIETAKRYLVGWWLMNYLETIMESYNANTNGAKTEPETAS